MHDVPQNLLQQIKDFEDEFTVSREKLKAIVEHFIKELEKGRFVLRDAPSLRHCDELRLIKNKP